VSSVDAQELRAGAFALEVELDAGALREAFARAGFTAAHLQTLARGVKSSSPVDRALLERRTASQTPFHTLARLFFLGAPVSVEALAAAVAPVRAAQLFEAGFVRAAGDAVYGEIRIEEHRELLVCSDFVPEDGPVRPDHVMGVAPSAISLAAMTLTRSVDSTLDLGTGGGVQALLASRCSERVVATDICPRALSFAAMNARLNGIANIEFRAGSFFGPVAGEQFEQIISNPPFVVSPESRFVHRDGGLERDGVSELVARGVAAHLEEGGYAVMLLNWVHETEDDWSERPSAWTAGNGCDVRWIRFSDDDPPTYAASWLRQEEKGDVAAAAARLDHWTRSFEAAGIRRIASGAVMMRRRSGVRNWTRSENIPIEISLTACGPQIERLFDAEDLLRELGDERGLLDQRLRVHPDHHVEQRLVTRGEGWELLSTKLHITSGMDFCAGIDLPTMQFLAGLDGTRTVREAAVPVAEALDRTVEEVTPICLAMTRRLLRVGLLMRA
jgi:methylase of polypeptide subunit release factors